MNTLNYLLEIRQILAKIDITLRETIYKDVVSEYLLEEDNLNHYKNQLIEINELSKLDIKKIRELEIASLIINIQKLFNQVNLAIKNIDNKEQLSKQLIELKTNKIINKIETEYFNNNNLDDLIKEIIEEKEEYINKIISNRLNIEKNLKENNINHFNLTYNYYIINGHTCIDKEYIIQEYNKNINQNNPEINKMLNEIYEENLYYYQLNQEKERINSIKNSIIDWNLATNTNKSIKK